MATLQVVPQLLDLNHATIEGGQGALEVLVFGADLRWGGYGGEVGMWWWWWSARAYEGHMEAHGGAWRRMGAYGGV